MSVLIVTGAMASGKSTVAEALAARRSRGVHLRGDQFRRAIVAGREEMSANPTPEALAQLELRYRCACAVAREYHGAGFDVVYQDILLGSGLATVLALLNDLPCQVVVLCPSAEAIASREQARSKVGYGAVTIAQLQQALAETPKLGLWVDSTDQSADETVRYIERNLGRARVDPHQLPRR